MATDQGRQTDLFLNVPFAQRWECHKDTIHDLYINQDESVENVAAYMKANYLFDASVRQYKYQLKKWGYRKTVPKVVKEQAIKAIGKRVRAGNDVAGVRYKGEEIDKKRIRRFIRDESRLDRDWKLITLIFGAWNLPYKALKASSTLVSDHQSPFGGDWSTPNEISVFSPQNAVGSPRTHNLSPTNAPTPTTLAIRVKEKDDRTRYLIQGRTDDFLKDMPPSEKRIATTWLYHFWFFAFTTTKYWGIGPRNWTPALLGFQKFMDITTTPSTPAAIMDGTSDEINQSTRRANSAPSLCNWSIHCHEPHYEGIYSPPTEGEDADIDIQNPSQWPQWNQAPGPDGFVERLHEALQSNSFSTLETRDIPLTTSKIAWAASNSPEILKAEAVSFAIIARNEGLLWDLLDNNPSELDLTGLFPYHLAATYLDGSKACCGILATITSLSTRRNRIDNLYINDFGHTVLDSLMTTILKSHTSCTPAMVDERLKKSQRFAAEDVDICGRWDADSYCVREINARGSSRIPFSWKHMFCHTSAQAMCHSISVIFGRPYSPDINTPSGLFVRSCSSCNERLVPGPLHTLVLTAFHLAQNGSEGENLFGILACLICLLTYGADPTISVEMSVRELVGTSSGLECDHSRLNPAQLGEQVPTSVWSTWSDDVKLGWDTILSVLRFAQRERSLGGSRVRNSRQGMNFDFDHFDPFDEHRNAFIIDDCHPWEEMGSDEEEDDYGGGCIRCEVGNLCHGSKQLGTLWAAIQTEMLTYRRLKDGDPWLSDRFSMSIVRHGVKASEGFSDLAFVKDAMMNPWCRCGRFVDAQDTEIATAEEACAFYFSNLEDWRRSNFIRIPEFWG